MSRNYDIIHFIQERMKGMDDAAVSAVVRMFNRLEERKVYASALSTSITLHLALQYLELNPKLILGTVQYQGLSYPHAWIELDDKIFDLATYEDIQHHPVLKERELKLIKPQVNIEYEEAAEEIRYYPFQFGDMWQLHNMQRLVGKTFEEYAKASPYFDIYGDTCYILEISETSDNLDLLKAMAKLETIKDKDEIDDTTNIDEAEVQKKDAEKFGWLREKMKRLGEKLKKQSSPMRENGEGKRQDSDC